jgi:outer membrane lipoprotein
MSRDRRNRYLWVLMSWVMFMSTGCTHVISEPLRQQAQPLVSFAELRTNPQAFKGHTVILGGEILHTNNLRDGTRIEILQRPLSGAEMPRLTDTTGGRFMAFCSEYLDPAVYAPQRRITIAGRVLGSYIGKVGEVDYMYPLISCDETHLLSPASTALQRSTTYPWWYDTPYSYPWTVAPYPHAFWEPYGRHR